MEEEIAGDNNGYVRIAYQLFGSPIVNLSDCRDVQNLGKENKNERTPSQVAFKCKRVEESAGYRCIICYSTIDQNKTLHSLSSKDGSRQVEEMELFRTLKLRTGECVRNGDNVCDILEEAISRLSGEEPCQCFCPICNAACRKLLVNKRALLKLQLEICELEHKLFAAIQLSRKMSKNTSHSRSSSNKCDFDDDYISDNAIDDDIKTAHLKHEHLREPRPLAKRALASSRSKVRRNDSRKMWYRGMEIRKNKDSRFVCPLFGCSHNFKTRRVLYKHVRKRHPETKHDDEFDGNGYSCRICGFSCPDLIALNKHKRVNHPESRQYACMYCNKRFSAKMDLTVHLKQQHSTKRPYACTNCKCRFALKEALEFHRSVSHPKTGYGKNKSSILSKVNTSSKQWKKEYNKNWHGRVKEMFPHLPTREAYAAYSKVALTRRYRSNPVLADITRSDGKIFYRGREVLQNAERGYMCPLQCEIGFARRYLLYNHIGTAHSGLTKNIEKQQESNFEKKFSLQLKPSSSSKYSPKRKQSKCGMQMKCNSKNATKTEHVQQEDLLQVVHVQNDAQVNGDSVPILDLQGGARTISSPQVHPHPVDVKMEVNTATCLEDQNADYSEAHDLAKLTLGPYSTSFETETIFISEGNSLDNFLTEEEEETNVEELEQDISATEDSIPLTSYCQLFENNDEDSCKDNNFYSDSETRKLSPPRPRETEPIAKSSSKREMKKERDRVRSKQDHDRAKKMFPHLTTMEARSEYYRVMRAFRAPNFFQRCGGKVYFRDMEVVKTADNRFTCPFQCVRLYSTLASLGKHIKKIHPENTEKTPLLPTTETEKDDEDIPHDSAAEPVSQSQNSAKPVAIKPHFCIECGKGFFQEIELKDHLKTHSETEQPPDSSFDDVALD